MVLMAKLRYWTNPMRLTVVISTLLFKGGAFEGVVNQQDQKVLDRTVIGKLAGPDKDLAENDSYVVSSGQQTWL